MALLSSLVWNIVASLLFIVAVHRGDVTAVVAEPDGKQLTAHISLVALSKSANFVSNHFVCDSVVPTRLYLD